ncbi:MAG TPA: hypothetical protein VF669_17510 [Tepidisphaeraceae bacterium]|jgi:hypothetical protein
MRHLVVHVVMLVLFFCGAGHAQTTRPAPAAFAQTLTKIASGLVAGDTTPLSDAMDEGTPVTSFDAENPRSAEHLVLATTGGTMLANRAYAQLPNVLASDLANDFAKADYVPESLRKEMCPEQSAVVKANVTATQWVMQALEPTKRSLIGVLVIWPREVRASANVRPERVRPVFVLIKAEMQGDRPRIKQVVFGDPLDAK